jgi:hypothetical protein
MGRTPRRRRCPSPAASSPRRAAGAASPPWTMAREENSREPPAPARGTGTTQRQRKPPGSNTCPEQRGMQAAKLAGRAAAAPKLPSQQTEPNDEHAWIGSPAGGTKDRKETERRDQRAREERRAIPLFLHAGAHTCATYRMYRRGER